MSFITGNATVVNFLMRFPVLTPAVVAVAVTTAVVPKKVESVQTPIERIERKVEPARAYPIPAPTIPKSKKLKE